jgi:uncharacterized protein (UPF0335 family)
VNGDISFSAALNSVPFEAAMQRLRAGVRKGLIDPGYGTLTVQGRLLAERCQAITPPASLAQGRKAVARDINKAFQPLTVETFDSPSIRRIIRTDDRDAWRSFAQHATQRTIRNTEAIDFSPAHHQKQRRSRGRVFNSGGVVTLGPQAAAVRKYIRTVQSRVGWAKAGWNIALLGLGGRPRDAWVARHSVNRGRFVDGRSSSDPFVQAINDTGWGRDRNQSERIVRDAVRMRARDMQTFFNQQMRLAAAKAQASLPLAT